MRSLVVHEARPLDEDAKAAGVLRDVVVEVGRKAATRHLIRVIEIKCHVLLWRLGAGGVH